MKKGPFAGCVTTADFNKRLNHFFEICSPLELMAIWLKQPIFPRPVRTVQGKRKFAYMPWETRRRFARMVRRSRSARLRLRRFKRLEIATGANLYRSHTGSDKILLVCFCGQAGRLSMPLAIFLQFVPDDRFDVLVLNDSSKSLYLRGIPDVASDFSSALSFVADFSAENGYREIRCFGTSGGGAPAIYAACYLGATIGLSISGHHPALGAEYVGFPEECSGNELDCALSGGRASSANPELILVSGEHSELDRQGAETLQQRFPKARQIIVDDCDRHGVMVWLLERNALKPFLEDSIFLQKS